MTFVALSIADPEYIAVWLNPGHGDMRAVQMKQTDDITTDTSLVMREDSWPFSRQHGVDILP